MKNVLGISGIILAILFHSCKKEVESAVKDIDGNSYNTVNIGTQVWMKENLRTTRYQNGDLIGTTSPTTLDISGESEPKYQWAYEGSEKDIDAYGRLYTWSVINDSRNVCPAGWHVPSSSEWKVLTDYLINNGYGFEGNGNDIAKSLAAKSDWITVPTAGVVGNDLLSNNGSGFTGLPGGYRYASGSFTGNGLVGYWWSSTEISTSNSSSRYMRFGGKIVTADTKDKQYGFSLRCVHD